MSEEWFYYIVYLTFGFSALPCIILIISVFRKTQPNLITTIISILEFSTFSANVILDILNLGHVKIQFGIYYIIELICWNYILKKYYFKKNKSLLWFLLSFFAIIYFLNVGDYNYLKFLSKFTQFILGLNILLAELKNHNHSKTYFLFPVSIGLIMYSLVSMNLILFNSLIIQMNENNFSLTWSTHQFTAIIYFSLLSISLWKSQKT